MFMGGWSRSGGVAARSSSLGMSGWYARYRPSKYSGGSCKLQSNFRKNLFNSRGVNGYSKTDKYCSTKRMLANAPMRHNHVLLSNGGTREDGVALTFHRSASRKRCRLPGVPLYWNVACATKGSSPSFSGIRCTKNVWPLQKVATGRMPNMNFPS
jgi:hypothetical protein